MPSYDLQVRTKYLIANLNFVIIINGSRRPLHGAQNLGENGYSSKWVTGLKKFKILVRLIVSAGSYSHLGTPTGNLWQIYVSPSLDQSQFERVKFGCLNRNSVLRPVSTSPLWSGVRQDFVNA